MSEEKKISQKELRELKRLQKLEAEKERTEQLKVYEKKYAAFGYVCGIDEAGRGPIAGPLVVAGVCFPVDYHHEEIYDSKKISEKKRKELFRIILQDALWYKILIISPEEIDALNIYRATQKAM